MLTPDLDMAYIRHIRMMVTASVLLDLSHPAHPHLARTRDGIHLLTMLETGKRGLDTLQPREEALLHALRSDAARYPVTAPVFYQERTKNARVRFEQPGTLKSKPSRFAAR